METINFLEVYLRTLPSHIRELPCGLILSLFLILNTIFIHATFQTNEERKKNILYSKKIICVKSSDQFNLCGVV